MRERHVYGVSSLKEGQLVQVRGRRGWYAGGGWSSWDEGYMWYEAYGGWWPNNSGWLGSPQFVNYLINSGCAIEIPPIFDETPIEVSPTRPRALVINMHTAPGLG